MPHPVLVQISEYIVLMLGFRFCLQRNFIEITFPNEDECYTGNNNYQPHSPLTSPRGTKRRVRGYYITHMHNFSYFSSNIYLPTRPHKLFSTTWAFPTGFGQFLNPPHAWIFRWFYMIDSSNPWCIFWSTFIQHVYFYVDFYNFWVLSTNTRG